MKNILNACLLVVLSHYLPLGIAQENPVEKKLDALIQILKEPKDKSIEDYVTKHFDPSLLNAFPMQEHVSYLKQSAQQLGQFEVLGIDSNNGFDFNVDVQTPGEDEIKRYLIEFNPTPPHGLMGLQRTPYMSFEGIQVKDYDLLHKTLQEKADNNEFSGNLLISIDGKTVFSKAYGMAEKRFGIKNTLDTRFNVASITKDFTALSILQLSQAGKLNLDDTIGQYIPEFPKSMGDHITIRHLLTHQSGLDQSFSDPKFMQIKHRMNNIEDYIDIIKDDTLLFEPGTSDEYSNDGFEVLGIIVQRVSGMDYYDYVQRHVFDKAGMRNSGYMQVSLAQKNVARGYTNLSPLGPDEGFVRETVYMFPAIGSASGGAYSTTADMLKYMQAIEQGLFLDSAHQRLFLNGYQKDGPEIKDIPGKGGAGGAPGVSTLYLMNFAANIKVVILSNYDERLAEDLAMHLYRQLRNDG